MTKTSTVIYLLLAVASVALLVLWYVLGFHYIDDPLDLVVAIVWWVLIGVGIWAVVRADNRRKERVRTVYVGEAALTDAEGDGPAVTVPAVFNPEKGLVPMDGRGAQDVTYALLEDLEYGFGHEDFPQAGAFVPTYLVRTFTFKPESTDEEGNEVEATWRGEVLQPLGERNLRWEFADAQELGQILATL